MKIQDKTLFGTGLVMQLIQFGILGVFIISLLNWSWLTMKLISIILAVTAFCLYNGISIWLMKLSLHKEEVQKKK